jgi:hypothetical protein
VIGTSTKELRGSCRFAGSSSNAQGVRHKRELAQPGISSAVISGVAGRP